jgi:thiol-disulfide isomerase/thioredoxin
MAAAVKTTPESPQRGKRPKSRDSSSFGTILIVAAIGVLAIVATRQRSGPRVDVPAKDFALSTLDQGGQFRLSEHRGTPVLVEVFAGWCGACKSAAPMMSRVTQASRKREVRFLGVSVDGNASEAKATVENWGIPYDVALDDGTFSKDYEITVLPTFVLIDPDGNVRKVSSGVPREAELERWLGDVGAERL